MFRSFHVRVKLRVTRDHFEDVIVSCSGLVVSRLQRFRKWERSRRLFPNNTLFGSRDREGRSWEIRNSPEDFTRDERASFSLRAKRFTVYSHWFTLDVKPILLAV